MSWTKNRPTGVTYYNPDLAYKSYTLFTSACGYHATLLNMKGKIIHQWHSDEGLQHAYLLPNGNLLGHTLPPKQASGVENIGGGAAALLELDWEGNLVWSYRNPFLHHDHQRLSNGNTLILLWAKLSKTLTQQVQGGYYGEDTPEQMWGDVIQEITPSGKVVYEWRSWEHLNVTEDVMCPLESRKEWTHANSMCQLADGNFLISFRLIDTVAIVDRKTGKFKWKWGPGELSHQHHATLLDTGNILLFDNGSHRRGGPTYSRVLEVNPKTNQIEWIYQADTLVAFYSFFVSAAQRLPNGNTFITDGAHGRLFEITKEGEIVWEYISPYIFESSFGPTPAIFRAYRYDLGYSGLKMVNS